MPKWIGLLLLTVALTAQGREECNVLSSPIELPSPKAIEGQTLMLAGPGRLQLGLGSEAATFAHAPEILMVRYPDGATLSHRRLAETELRVDPAGELPFSDFIRLVFKAEVLDASDADRKEADMVWNSIEQGCTSAKYYRLDGIDIFTYSQTRIGNERYHAFFIIDGGIVHYIDVIDSDTLGPEILATMSKRN